MHATPRRRTVTVAATAAALLAGLFAAPATGRPASAHAEQPRRVVEDLDRGLVAVPSAEGTFLSWRLLGTEYARHGESIAFNVYKNGRRLNREPVRKSTTYRDATPGNGNGSYTVRAVVDGREAKASSPALDFAGGYAEIPLSAADGYTVQHAWPGDLDGDGRYELVVSRLARTRDRPDLLEAYTLTGERLWRVDLGVGSLTQAGGNGANDPAPAAISGSTAIGGYRNDDNVTVYDLDSDGKAEVLVHTAAGTTFADGARVTAGSPADQFVSVIDGATGAERVRQPVPDDFVADGPSGGHFGIAHLDGVHPSLVTKLVTRVGARRGTFRTLFQTWDFDGTDLTRRWKYVVDPASGATSFHQIRTVDVDGDGKDEIADGNYVVNSDGTLRYVVDGAIHGDRFDIADLDPARPGLEGFAIQQSELGIVSDFPWYYYDADTGERLVTGAHPVSPVSDADLDVGRGSAADIDPGHPGYEYWTSTADVTRPGAGVFNVRDGKVSATTPSVNFRIWWDGDKASELLDLTHVEKWDPATETATRLFDPAGVVSGARNATPFYGDLVGDWREEILAETADHTALRLHTTTEPTRTRVYTLAHNPAYRLGWTVRGYLQSTYTDYYLGTETRRIPAPRITTPGATPSARPTTP
ncbi:rhamnogalacturonan lyase family protein [Streptomyces bobili]